MGAGQGKTRRIRVINTNTSIKKYPKPKFNLGDQVAVDSVERTGPISVITYNGEKNIYEYCLAGFRTAYVENQITLIKSALSQNQGAKDYRNYLSRNIIFQWNQSWELIPEMEWLDGEDARITGVTGDNVPGDVEFTLHFDTANKETQWEIRNFHFTEEDFKRVARVKSLDASELSDVPSF